MNTTTVPPGLQAEDFDNLRHMLGATNSTPRNRWGYRNWFACGQRDVRSMNRLLAAGYVRRGKRYETDFYYHATAQGQQLAGVTNAQY